MVLIHNPSLVPRSHSAFSCLQYEKAVEFSIHMRGEPGNEANTHLQSCVLRPGLNDDAVITFQNKIHTNK